MAAAIQWYPFIFDRIKKYCFTDHPLLPTEGRSNDLCKFQAIICREYTKELLLAVDDADKTKIIARLNQPSARWIILFNHLNIFRTSNSKPWMEDFLRWLTQNTQPTNDVLDLCFTVSEVRQFDNLKTLTRELMYQPAVVPDTAEGSVDAANDTSHGLNPTAMAVICFTRCGITPCRRLFIELLNRGADCSFIQQPGGLAWREMTTSISVMDEVAMYLLRRDVNRFTAYADALEQDKSGRPRYPDGSIVESQFVCGVKAYVDDLAVNSPLFVLVENVKYLKISAKAVLDLCYNKYVAGKFLTQTDVTNFLETNVR